jgi:hypothetical protein
MVLSLALLRACFQVQLSLIAIMGNGLSLFGFAKFIFKQRLNLDERLIGVIAFGFNIDCDTLARSQHHDTHDAFCINPLGGPGDKDFAFELAGQLGKLGGSAGMQP